MPARLDPSLVCAYAGLPTGLAMTMISRQHGLNGIQYHSVFAAHARGDWVAVRRYLADWSNAQVVRVTKFHPGDHYHVLGIKFDTLDLARRHLEFEGCLFGGLDETFVYVD
jgi:hypothetical protein